MEQTTGSHQHCFCNQDTGGNIKCCKCDAILMACENCKVRFCSIREGMIIATGHHGFFMPNCPVASSNYAFTYKREIAEWKESN